MFFIFINGSSIFGPSILLDPFLVGPSTSFMFLSQRKMLMCTPVHPTYAGRCAQLILLLVPPVHVGSGTSTSSKSSSSELQVWTTSPHRLVACASWTPHCLLVKGRPPCQSTVLSSRVPSRPALRAKCVCTLYILHALLTITFDNALACRSSKRPLTSCMSNTTAR